MSSPAVKIKTILVNEEVALETATALVPWTVMVSRFTEHPDRQVVVYDTPGLNPNPKWLVDYPTIQVLVRGPVDGYQAAWDKCKEVKDVLLGRDPEIVDGDLIDGIVGMGDIAPLGYDDQNRPRLVVNFRLIVEPVPTPNSNREEL